MVIQLHTLTCITLDLTEKLKEKLNETGLIKVFKSASNFYKKNSKKFMVLLIREC